MVAGTASMLAMESEADLEALVSARRRVEGMGSKGPPALPLSYERQASGVLSSEASEPARVRCPDPADAAAAMVLAWALDPGAGSWALACCVISVVSTWLGSGGEGSLGFPLAWPLSCGMLFCFVIFLPGAARPFSCRLSCAAFLFDFATIDGGAGASGQTSPWRDSTAAQDEPGLEDVEPLLGGGVWGGVVCWARRVGSEEGALRLLSRAFRRMGSCQDLQVLNVKCKVNQENPTAQASARVGHAVTRALTSHDAPDG